MKYGTPVTGSICIGIRSFTGGSLKCSGKKHDPGIKLASVSTSMSSDPTELVTLTLEPFANPSRSMSSGFIDRRPELDPGRLSILFCNGPQCPQSPDAIRQLLQVGHPASGLAHYRGGMHDWVTLAMPTQVRED